MLNQDKILHTIFGTAKIDHHGYYIITTRKEGNNNQQLHRLIYEKFWGVKIPKGVVIHHKDGNKLNNCILNLEAMTSSDHWKLHTSNENNPMYNKNHSLDSVLKMKCLSVLLKVSLSIISSLSYSIALIIIFCLPL